MIVLDVNVLLDAHNTAAARHARAHAWLTEALMGTRRMGLPLVTALGFVRIVTNPRALAQPLGVDQAIDALAVVRGAGVVEEIAPSREHWERMRALAADAQLAGAAMTDVHLAALALERGAALATYDRGFRRFPDLEVIEPG